MAEKNDVELGRLEKVKLRDFWRDEAKDFTPWLAKEENLKVLSETLGMDLEPKETEAAVGSYRADIVCRDTGSDSLVLIENQLEKTDHSHLGQLMTYAAGLGAVTAVWIAEQFTDRHRAAMDWLNEISSDDSNFFGLEIELWRIGDSLPAPKFNIAAKPNNWSRNTKRIASGELSEINALHLKYWTTLRDVLKDEGSSVSITTPPARHYCFLGLGRSEFRLNLSASVQKKELTAGIVILNDLGGDLLNQLSAQKNDIENTVGGKLEWVSSLGIKSSYAQLTRKNANPRDESDWKNQHRWFADMLPRLDKAFRERVKNLDPIPNADE